MIGRRFQGKDAGPLGSPHDGDHSSGEQALVAQVIPLRRRGSDAELRDEQAAHSGVFDPPPEPEPPQEYSVWERPTAELIRRTHCDENKRGGERRAVWRPSRRRVVTAALAALICVAGFGIASSGSHRRAQRSAALTRPPEQLGLGAPLSGRTPRGATRHLELRSRSSPTSQSRRHTRSTDVRSAPSVGTGSRQSRGGSTGVVTAGSRGSEASEPHNGSSEQTQTSAQSAVATAAREFGFER
jgi:hypothetical protein